MNVLGYVNIFVPFTLPDSAHSFPEYMYFKPQNVSFSTEHEELKSFSFLDLKICSKNGKFVTSVYRKSRFSGVFTKYEHFIPTYQKREPEHYYIGVFTYALILNLKII